MVLAPVNFNVIGVKICLRRLFDDTENKVARSGEITYGYMRLCSQGGTETHQNLQKLT